MNGRDSKLWLLVTIASLALIGACGAVNYRLDTSVIPSFYNLSIQLFDHTDNSIFDGEATIDIKTFKTDVKQITLHKDSLDIVACALHDGSTGALVEQIDITRLTYESLTHQLTVPLKAALIDQNTYTLKFKYTGKIRTDMAGLFWANYTTLNSEKKEENHLVLITQMQRLNARLVLPCFDEPAFKAKFQVHIRRPEHGFMRAYETFSNTKRTHTTKESENRFTDHFEVTPPMSTYLLAFAVSEFQVRGNESEFAVISRPDYFYKTDFSYEVGKRMLPAYGEQFESNYTQLGNDVLLYLSSPRFPHNGMENWGLIIYSDDVLAMDSYSDGYNNKEYTIRIIAHETSHMWFGNSVTFKWWSYFWLNEAFARYYEYFMANSLFPDYQLDQQFVVRQLQMIMVTDSQNKTQPMTSPEDSIQTPTEIASKFSSIAYAKGASIVRMWRNIMGGNNFYSAINAYLLQRHLGNTVPADLFTHLKEHWPAQSQEVKADLDEFFYDWTEQVGYPVMIANVSEGNRLITLKQQRFLLNPKDGSDTKLRYTVPITFATNTKPTFDTLTPRFYYLRNLTELRLNSEQPLDWIIFNLKQSNYYRVLYDTPLLRGLRNALFADKHSSIPVENRAGLIDDLFNFASAGMIDYAVVFEFMEYLSKELEYIPFYAAFENMQHVAKRLTPAQLPDFTRYLGDITSAAFNKLGVDWDFMDKVLDVYNRNKLVSWLCKYQHAACNNKVRVRFELNKRMPTPDYRENYYCAASRVGGYDHVMALYTNETFAKEKQLLWRAASCTRDYKMHYNNEVLNKSRDADLKTTALKQLYEQNPDLVTPVFQMINENVTQLAESLSSWDKTAEALSNLSEYFTTRDQQKMFVDFCEKNSTLFGSSADTLKKALVTVESNIQWGEQRLPGLVKYLHERNGATGLTLATSLLLLIAAVFNVKTAFAMNGWTSKLWLLATIALIALIGTNGAVDYRLDRSVIPSFYNLSIKLFDHEDNRIFDGSVSIDIQTFETNIKEIKLHKDLLDIQGCALYKTGQLVEKIDIARLDYKSETQTLTIPLTDVLIDQVTYTLNFNYTGHIRTDMSGLYVADYNNIMLLTHMHGLNARLVLPCFDEPAFKAKFQLHIRRSSAYQCFSNTKLASTTQESANRYTDHFEVTPPMSTYLLAFAVSEFKYLGNLSEFAVISQPDHYMNTEFSYNVGKRLLPAYGELFEQNYTQLGNEALLFLASPRFRHSGMENWGLVIFRDNILLQSPGYTDGWSNKETTISVISHEISHMWFGNSVTFKWWNYYWLNEGFANYYGYFMTNALYPEYQLDQQFVVKELQKIMVTDSQNKTQPMTSPEDSIHTPAEISSKFSNIAYAKGASIVRMWRNIMGGSKFSEAINGYLHQRHLGNAVPVDLFTHLKEHWPAQSQEVKADLDEFFYDWTEQVGYPVMIANVSEGNRLITLKQQRFLLNPKDGSDTKLRYTVPITFATNTKPTFDTLTPRFYYLRNLTELRLNSEQPLDWIIFNLKQSNYYRVLYDTPLLRGLRNALFADKHSSIPVENRAGLIDDLFNFASAGMIDYAVVFEFMEYLSKELEYIPFYAAFENMQHVAKRLTPAQLPDFTRYLGDITSAAFNKLGVDWDNKDKVLDVYNRNKQVAWLCKYQHAACNNKIRERFASNKSKPTPDYRESYFCAASRVGGYDHVMDLYSKETFVSDMQLLWRAASCTRDYQKHYKNEILTNSRDVELKMTALQQLYQQNPDLVTPIFQMINENVTQLEEALYGWDKTAEALSNLSEYFTTRDQQKMFVDFCEKNSTLFGSSADTLKKALVTVESNIQWGEQRLPGLVKYLHERNGATALTVATSLLLLIAAVLRLQ
ncbi:uncharacterized protein LOC108601287 [Drosophila busckii]|uniref:uncharacterized protein LOC108601287 n=1 Tax=Drosophila busckii TaxID=30019 RepID=UPI001432CA22|nr:uncharacterized protein LOC108601287 [Drosophila busckii]